MFLALLYKIPFYFAVVGDCNPNTDNTSNPFFGFAHWWKYISKGEKDVFGNCTPVVTFPDGIWAIAFAVADMLLYLAGLVAVFAIIVSGVMYLTADGNPEQAKAARRRIYNSIIGLAIVLVAAPTVAFLGNRIGGQ